MDITKIFESDHPRHELFNARLSALKDLIMCDQILKDLDSPEFAPAVPEHN